MEAESMKNEEPTAIVKPIAAPLVVKTPRATMLAQALEEEREQRMLLKKYVDEFMVPGEDFGIIPGTKKPTLLKPGAEKLFDLFRCRPEYEITREVDREAGLYSYEIRCKAVSRETDTVLNEGMGSASSYESKYRYRNAARLCPNCGKDTIIKGKAEYGGGWVCFAKKGGCGAKWSDGAPEIEGQEVGKIQNPDLADVANTVLKMAKKRAQVDCAIALARVSDMFTQDVEDMVDHAEAAQQKPPPARPAAKPAPAPESVSTPPAGRTINPPGVALFDRLEAERPDSCSREWFKAARTVFGGAFPEAAKWTPEQVEAVERILFPEKP